MIVRMSKIMVIGSQDLLMDTLSLIKQLEIMQLEEDILTDLDESDAQSHPVHLDTSSVMEHQFYTRLGKKIDELLQYLPPLETSRQPSMMPIESLALYVPDHLEQVAEQFHSIKILSSELSQLTVYTTFLNVFDEIGHDNLREEEVVCIGVKLATPKDISLLKGRLESEVDGKITVENVPDDAELVKYVILTETELSGKVCNIITECGATGFTSPPGLAELSYGEQKKAVALQIAEKKNQLKKLKSEQEQFVRQWQEVYLTARNCIIERLSLIRVTASVVRSRMCFFIHGWLPAVDFATLDEELKNRFKGKVLLEECKLVEQDFSRVPTALHNPAYFRPFELFARLLPMPSYASFDLTPFIGIFFPIFFGMMLGDAGYGILLAFLAVFLTRQFADRKNIQDAGKILFISSLYTLFFGIMYGEFFGSLGHVYLGMKPIFFDRQTTVIPMFCFAIAAGVVHVTLGLILGIVQSIRLKMKKEAVFKLVNILVILCLCVFIVSYYTPTLEMVREPLLISIAICIPVLLLTGGIMAPLELMKNIGSIISYARIMAVGLASVLLAFVANYMGGKIESVWAGVFVAVIIHIFNLLLGVFAPTIHSLRLHYVEFLGKFMEPGGRKFTPFGKK